MCVGRVYWGYWLCRDYVPKFDTIVWVRSISRLNLLSVKWRIISPWMCSMLVHTYLNYTPSLVLNQLQTMPEEIAQMLSDALKEGEAPISVFSAVKRHLYQHLNEKYMDGFSKRFVHLFCLWYSLRVSTRKISDHSALSTPVILSWILGPLLQAIVQVSPFVICFIWSIHVVLTCAEVVLANLPSLPFPPSLFTLSQEYVRFCQWKYLELLTPDLVSCECLYCVWMVLYFALLPWLCNYTT